MARAVREREARGAANHSGSTEPGARSSNRARVFGSSAFCSPLRAPCFRCRAHHRTSCSVSSKHDRVPHGADRNLLPRHLGDHARRAPQSPQHAARGERQEDLVHAPHRVRHRAGGEALSGHDPRVPGNRRQAASRRSGRDRTGPGGRRRKEGRQQSARRPGDQARRVDGLCGISRGVRNAGREGAHQSALAR